MATPGIDFGMESAGDLVHRGGSCTAGENLDTLVLAAPWTLVLHALERRRGIATCARGGTHCGIHAFRSTPPNDGPVVLAVLWETNTHRARRSLHPGAEPGLTRNGRFVEVGGAGDGFRWAGADRAPDCAKQDVGIDRLAQAGIGAHRA